MTHPGEVEASCPACESVLGSPAFRARAYASGHPRVRFQYCRCLGCGALYLSPRVARREMDRFYPGSYHPLRPPGERIERGLHQLGLLLKMGLTRPKTLLDWGCGGGELVQVLRTLGIDAYGYDAFGTEDGSAAGILRRLQDVERVLSKVDCVSFLDALEHLDDPGEVLRFLAARSRADVYLFVPCGDSLELEVFGRFAYVVQAPNHVFLPTERSLRALAARTGWRMDPGPPLHTEFWELDWQLRLGVRVFAAQGERRFWDRLGQRFARLCCRLDPRVRRGSPAHLSAVLRRTDHTT
jgi:hypothetical protein